MDFFNDLQDFFSGLSQQEGLFVLLTCLVVFLVGFLLAILLRGASLRRYKKHLALAEKERTDYEAQYLAVNEKQKALAKEVEVLSREKVYALEQLEVARNETGSDVDLRNDHWEAEKATYEDRITLLKTELVTAQESLQAALAAQQNQDLQSSNVQTSTAASLNEDQVQDYLTAAEARFNAFENRLSELAGENARLENEIQHLQNIHNTPPEPVSEEVDLPPFGTPHRPVVGQPAIETDEDGEPLVIRADVTAPGVRTNTAGNTEIIVDSPTSVQIPVMVNGEGNGDDLKAIKNIGPFLEKKLNEAGINAYEQIARWTAADIERFTKEIGYLPGRIALDNWVGQAQKLAGISTTAPKKDKKTAKSKPKSKKSTTTNLKIIEGIGPKIEEVLKKAGIQDLTKLAKTKPEAIRKILAEAGSRYRVHDPSSWPAQAILAKDGKLDELVRFQETLK